MVIIVGTFTYVAAADAVSIEQNLQKQNEHIQSLNTEYKKIMIPSITYDNHNVHT